VTEEGFKFALIAIRQVDDGPNAVSVMDDIGWLDTERVAGEVTGRSILDIPSAPHS